MAIEVKKRKFKALRDEYGKDDGGVASFTFEVKTLTKDKIYEEHTPWKNPVEGYVPSGYVIDDNACWWRIGGKGFKERFKEMDI